MSKSHELISAIYAATVLPEEFNRKFDDLESLLFDDLAEVDAAALTGLPPETLAHIENARSIQNRMGTSRSRDQQMEGIVGAVPNPSYLVTRRGTIAALNAMARLRHDREPAGLGDCIADAAARQQVSAFIASDKTGKLLAVPAGEGPLGADAISILVRRVDPALLGGEQLFFLSIVGLGLDDGAIRLFRQAFGLTEAETRVAVLLVSGLRLPDIAIERQVSIDTVRTQVKTIKSKTAVRDIPALVRLMYGFNAGALAPTALDTAPAPRVAPGPLRARRSVTLRGGRRLEFLEQGAADGQAVLLFHNVPYGVELPAAAIAEARSRGLRVIAPLRPGYGSSDTVAAQGDALLMQVADDCAELLGQLGIRQVVAVSHAVGAAFALRFAARYPAMVTRLIGVSRAPTWRDEWLGTMPQRQRFMLRLTKYAPQLLPVVAWGMRTVMDSESAKDFVIYNCKEGAADARATENDETVSLIARGSVEAMRHGLDGLVKDCEMVLRDFTAEARATPHKFHLLHGAGDCIIDPAQALTFAREVPGTTVEMVEDAGQLLFYSHWQRVLDAVTAPTPVALSEPAAE